MNADRWNRVEQCYHSALERAPSERAGFLAGACANDPELLREVESLLAHETTADSFLEGPAWNPPTAAGARRAAAPGELGEGSILASYRIEGKLGSGGMGDVYLATDTRLQRQAALKVLPSGFASDSNWLSRFQREARILASLNHPNIAAIYGLEESGGVRAIAMELVEGPTLAERLARGRIPIEDAIGIARQAAEALEYAHERGVVHRDLKPDNVKLRPDGVVKVLDFGLAKAVQPNETQPPTSTGMGLVLGTPAYMAPEQAAGVPVDRRADIWAFGVVLFEMLAGRQIFTRKTTSETLAAIAAVEPPWEALPKDTPPAILRLLRRCLDKDPKSRLRDIGEARVALEDPQEIASPFRIPLRAGKWRSLNVLWLPLAAAAGFLAAALWPTPPAAAPKLTLFAADAEMETMPAWSPKGDRIAYVADANGTLQVFTKAPGLLTPTQMTHQQTSCYSPAWSQDGSRIYFQSADRLYSVAVAGGPPQLILTGFSFAAISPTGNSLAALARGDDGKVRLAFSTPIGLPLKPYTHPLMSGVTATEPSSSFAFARDGKSLGFIGYRQGKSEFWTIPVGGGSPVQKTYAGKDFLFFTWLTGERILSASTGSSESHLTITNLRTADSYPITSGGARDGYPALSPDGRTLAYSAGEAAYSIIEVPLTVGPSREVIGSAHNGVAPSWAPDGRHFAYITNRNGAQEIWYRDQTDGSERRIVGQKEFGPGVSRFLDCAVSPDGNRIAYRRDGGKHEIWISPLSGELPVRLWDDPARAYQRGPVWSPDGEWIAYYSLWQGKYAVLKTRVGANTQPELVAYSYWGSPPAWSPLGDRIAFRDGNRMRIVSPDGKDLPLATQSQWETYGWSKDASALYGIAVENRRFGLKRLATATGIETKIADLGPVPPGYDLATRQGVFWYRGFSLNPDGKAFLTSVYRMKAHLWLMEDFDRPTRLLDFLWTPNWKRGE